MTQNARDPFADGDLGPITEAPAPIGHNNPPANLQERLDQTHKDLRTRVEALLAQARGVPASLGADLEGKVTDLVSLMKAAKKELERLHRQEKEPYLSGGRIVDAYFKAPADTLTQWATDLERRLGAWLQQKAAEERRQREAREAAERAEAARRFEEAVAAQEAETAAATAADAAAAATQAAAMDLDAARRAVEDATNAYVTARNEATAAQNAGDGKAYADAKARMAVAEAAGKAARARATQLADEVAAAKRREELAQQEAEATARAAARTMDAATAAEDSAAKLAKQAAAPVKDLSRTRGQIGQSGLRQSWTFDGYDRAKLDLEALRQHLPDEALQQAIRSFIRAGGRNLRGVSIYEDAKAVVR